MGPFHEVDFTKIRLVNDTRQDRIRFVIGSRKMVQFVVA